MRPASIQLTWDKSCISVWDVSSKNECSGVPGQKLENATKIGLKKPDVGRFKSIFLRFK